MLTFISSQLKAKKIAVIKTRKLAPISINIGSSHFDIVRELLVNKLKITNIKFAEKIQFVGKGIKNYAIAIGYNPSKAVTKAIDHTNELIAFYLYKNGYDGYYLLNLFPDVQPTKVLKSVSLYPNFSTILNATLNKFKLDSFIFWGSSVYLSSDLATMLNSLTQKVYTIGAKVGSNSYLHKHPGRNVSHFTINGNLRNKPILLSQKNSGYLR
jgi:hypothetical protein